MYEASKLPICTRVHTACANLGGTVSSTEQLSFKVLAVELVKIALSS